MTDKKNKKGKGLVVAVVEELKKGSTDLEKIAKKTGASLGTVKTQFYLNGGSKKRKK